MSKIFFKVNNLLILIFWIPAIALWGCTTTKPIVDSASSQNIPSKTSDSITDQSQPHPSTLASLQLTSQGLILLESGKPDDAIRLLERAMSLNPANGQNYFYLAEAWLLKGNISQAEEFNRLANIYLKSDIWINKISKQKQQIMDQEK